MRGLLQPAPPPDHLDPAYAHGVNEIEYPHEHLIGPRFPDNPAAQTYYPDAEFKVHPVDAIHPTIWYNQRRLVNMTILNTEWADAIMSLFIPFSDGQKNPPLLFETIHLCGDIGWIKRRASDIVTARANHRAVTAELCERFELPFPINDHEQPSSRR